MRVRKIVVAAVFVCGTALFSAAAMAQNAMRVSPTTFSPGDESFLSLYVSGIVETDVVTVTYSRPAGQPISVEPSAIWATHIEAWVPSEITLVEGTYSVDVYVLRNNATTHYGPATFTVTVPPPPPNPPVLLFTPEAVVVEAVSAAGAPVTYSVSTNDGTIPSCAPASNTWFPLGASTVTCTANNGSTSATASFPVYVQDTTAPVLTVPADIVSSNPVGTFTATATDTFDPAPVVSCIPASGTTFPSGTTKVRCEATDSQLNVAFGSFNVTINDGSPVLTVPDDMTVEATGPDGAVVAYTVTATNGGVVTCAPPSGSTFPLGTTQVDCTATNPDGSASASFNVTVVDTEGPTIIRVQATPYMLWPPDHKMVPISLSVIAIDAVDPSPTTTIVAISSNQPVNGTGDGDTAPDWEITGALTANLRAERAGETTRVYTITVQSVDDSGNISTATTEVTVASSRRRSLR